MRPFLTALLFLAPSLALAQVEVTDAWVRASVPGQRVTGAFMKLVAANDATLVEAVSPVATVEIHETRAEGNLMRMRAVARVALPAGKTVALEAGGYHLMLMALAKPLSVDAIVPITLTFEDAAGKRFVVEVRARVRPLTQAPAKHAH